MINIELAVAEIRAALRTSARVGYTKESFVEAGSLIEKLYNSLTDEVMRRDLFGVYRDLKERYERAEAKRKEERPVRTGVATVDISSVLPATAPSDITVGKYFSVSDVESKNGYLDNTAYFFGPYADELDYLVRAYAKKKGLILRTVDCARLVAQKSERTVADVLSALSEYARSAEGELFAYESVSSLGDGADLDALIYYISVMRRECRGIRQIILTDDVNCRLDEKYGLFMHSRVEGDSYLEAYLQSLPAYAISLPTAVTVREAVRDAIGSALTDEDEGDIKKTGAYLGYTGLCRISEAGAGWRSVASAYATQRGARLDDFMRSLGDPSCYDLSDWDVKLTGAKEKGRQIRSDVLHPKYTLPRDEYDGVLGNEQIKRRMERLMNTPCPSLRAKCAWAVSYALDGGDSLNIMNLSPAEASGVLTERWELAYLALVELLHLERGKLVMDIRGSSGLLGQCCDGGRTIRMHEKFSKTNSKEAVMEGRATLLHEAFHALQHKAVSALNTGRSEELSYYLVHLGINSHVREWQRNFSRYKKSEDGAESYEDQLVEAEARIFAADCLAEFDLFNPPRLD